MNLNDLFTEEKVRLDPKCWTGKKIGNPKTKVKGGVRVNNCVPKESVEEGEVKQFPNKHTGDLDDVHECVKCGGDLKGGTYMGQRIKVCIPCKQVYLPPNSNIDQNGNKIAEQDMAENTAAGINKMFNNLGDPVYANLQRVALLAMQGRQLEAAGRLQTVIKDASPDVQKKITDAVNNIKPVTINGRVADSSTLDKSKQHNDWIINTFIPWVQSLLGQQGMAEDDDAVAAFMARGGEIQRLKPAKPRKGERWQGSSHIGAAGGRGTKGRVSGLGANTGKSGKPVVTAEDINDPYSVVSTKSDMTTKDANGKPTQVYKSTTTATDPSTGKFKKMTSTDDNGKASSVFTDPEGNEHLDEVSLGDYRKKAQVSQAGAKINKFFDRDNPEKVAAADRTIAKRERGLGRADARVKPYTPPKMNTGKQQQELTAKYPNIDELVRQAELRRDPNYEYADGNAYYDGRDAEQKYQRLLGIQRIIQGLSESKTLSDYMDEAKGIRNPYDLQPLEGPGGSGGGGGGLTRSGPSPFGAKPGSREASIAQPNANTMTVKQGSNPDYVPPKTLKQKYDDLNLKLDQLPPTPPVKTPRPGREAADQRRTDQAQAPKLKDVVPLSPAEISQLRPIDANKVRQSKLNKEPPDLGNVRPGLDEESRKKREQPEVDYDDEYQAMVARVRKLAGIGPMKTVYDPAKRQYRNMPTAQQPKK